MLIPIIIAHLSKTIWRKREDSLFDSMAEFFVCAFEMSDLTGSDERFGGSQVANDIWNHSGFRFGALNLVKTTRLNEIGVS